MDQSLPIACTLSSSDLASRIEELRALGGDGLSRPPRRPAGRSSASARSGHRAPHRGRGCRGGGVLRLPRLPNREPDGRHGALTITARTGAARRSRSSSRRSAPRRAPATPAARRLAHLAAVLGRDQHEREQRADRRDHAAGEERGLEAFGERRPSGRAPSRREHVLRAVEFAIVDEDREAERAADLLGGVDEPGREPRLVRLRARDRPDRHRDEREPEPDRREHLREQDVAHVRAARRAHAAEPEQPGRGEQRARSRARA